MKRFLIFFFLAVGVVLPDLGRCELVGIVADSSGAVSVLGDTHNPVMPFLRVADETRISLENRSSVRILFYQAGKVETWSGPADVMITRAGGECLRCGVPPLVEVLPSSAPKLAESSMLNGQKTITSGGGDVRSISARTGVHSLPNFKDNVELILYAVKLEQDGDIDSADALLSQRLRNPGEGGKVYDLIRDLQEFNR